MTKQIEVLSPDDPFFSKLAERCAIYTGNSTFDNETGAPIKIYVPKNKKNYETKKDCPL